MRFLEHRFVKTLLMMASSTFLYYQGLQPSYANCLVGFVLGIVLLIYAWGQIGYFYTLSLSFGMAFCFAFFAYLRFQDPQQNPEHYLNSKPSKESVMAQIISTPKIQTKRISMHLRLVQGKDTLGNTHKIKGDLLVSMVKTEKNQNMQIGDFLVFPLNPKPLPQKDLLDDFDYAKYLREQNIFAQQFIAKEHFVHIPQRSTSLTFTALRLQQKASKVLHKIIPNPESEALLNALVLGEKSKLSADIKNAFSETGAIHVLAVSGLHIGIFAWLIALLAKPFKRIKKAGVFIEIVTLLLIWTYAGITGFSDSVLRCAGMYSIFKYLQWRKIPYTALEVVYLSAIILLCFNPLQLFSVGFQLSYGAVIGILTVLEKLNSLYTFKNKIAHWFWNLNNVGFASQAGILPLVFYYFKKFPVLFWLINPFVILLATAMLPLTLCALFCSFFSMQIAQFFSKYISILCQIMLKGVFWLEQFSFLNIRWQINQWAEIMLLYVAIILLYQSWQKQRFKLLLSAVFLLACLQSSQWWWQYRMKEQVFIASTGGEDFLIYINKQEKYLFSSQNGKAENKQKMLQKLAKYQNVAPKITDTLYHDDKNLVKNKFYKQENLFLFPAQGVLKINHPKEVKNLLPKQWQEKTIVWITSTERISLQELHKKIPFDKVVLSASLPQKHHKWYDAQAKALNVEIHYLVKQGTFSAFI
jgi:competence protein ComEC